MTHTVFIDGEAGTTGLKIFELLHDRIDIQLIHLSDAHRKETQARTEALNVADVVILCLPENASREAISLIENHTSRVIDTSISYRIDPGWVFGFPELRPGQRDKIKGAKRVTNPGCYSCGAISILHPLVSSGLVPKDHPVTINAVSGYSGGGKKLIEAFENEISTNKTNVTFYHYSLNLEHKHIQEIQVHSGLTQRPLFVPSVGQFFQGMVVSVPLQLWAIPCEPKLEDIHSALLDHYDGQNFVTVEDRVNADAMVEQLDPESLNNTNHLKLTVFGNQAHGQAVVTAVLDNLGKGASGQAVQCLNLMLGQDEETGL